MARSRISFALRVGVAAGTGRLVATGAAAIAARTSAAKNIGIIFFLANDHHNRFAIHSRRTSPLPPDCLSPIIHSLYVLYTFSLGKRVDVGDERTRHMMRGALAAVVWSAVILLTAVAARADACSDSWFYAALAATGERDLNQYMGEGGTQTAKSDFDIVARNMDLAGRTIDACRQADTIAKYAFTDAARWQIGFDRGWVPAPVAAIRVHSALRRLK